MLYFHFDFSSKVFETKMDGFRLIPTLYSFQKTFGVYILSTGTFMPSTENVDIMRD